MKKKKRKKKIEKYKFLYFVFHQLFSFIYLIYYNFYIKIKFSIIFHWFEAITSCDKNSWTKSIESSNFLTHKKLLQIMCWTFVISHMCQIFIHVYLRGDNVDFKGNWQRMRKYLEIGSHCGDISFIWLCHVREEAWVKGLEKISNRKLCVFENFGGNVVHMIKYRMILEEYSEHSFREIPDEYSRILSDM